MLALSTPCLSLPICKLLRSVGSIFACICVNWVWEPNEPENCYSSSELGLLRLVSTQMRQMASWNFCFYMNLSLFGCYHILPIPTPPPPHVWLWMVTSLGQRLSSFSHVCTTPCTIRPWSFTGVLQHYFVKIIRCRNYLTRFSRSSGLSTPHRLGLLLFFLLHYPVASPTPHTSDCVQLTKPKQAKSQ